MDTIYPEDMTIPQVRKSLHQLRASWAENSPNSVFYPSKLLSNGMSMETFALAQVSGSHKKRHSKSKQSK